MRAGSQTDCQRDRQAGSNEAWRWQFDVLHKSARVDDEDADNNDGEDDDDNWYDGDVKGPEGNDDWNNASES